LLLICLSISVLLNIFLYEQAFAYYRQLNDTRLDPLGLQVYQTDPKLMSIQSAEKTQVIFFGDSRAAEWPAPNLGNFVFVNRGIGAQTSTQTAARFEQHVQPLQPDIILLQVGINDLKTIPLHPERKNSIVANCQKQIEDIVARVLEIEAVIIITTIFPVGQPPIVRMPFWSDDIAQAVADVNVHIYSLAGPNVIVFDTFSVLADENGLVKTHYMRDELHLNEQGYAVLNTALKELLTGIDP
jgi:lysophospholipase L1-like esterase